MDGTIVLGIVAVLAVAGITAAKFSTIAEEKGYTGYFWWCFLLGIFGCLMVVALPDRKSNPVNAQKSAPTSESEGDELPNL